MMDRSGELARGSLSELDRRQDYTFGLGPVRCRKLRDLLPDSVDGRVT